MSGRTWRVLAWCGSLLGYVGLITYGAKGLRGSDQYWYAADLVMARAGRGVVSNFITPVVWANGGGFDPAHLPPPVHNVPVTYLARAFDVLLHDVYASWLLTNALLGVVTALLVSWVARSILDPWPATLAGILFLLGPQTIWLALNPLAEQALVCAVMVLLSGAVLVDRRPLVGVSVLAAATAFMAVSRSSFVLLIPLGIVFLLWMARRGVLSRWWALGYVTLSALGFLVGGILLPQFPLFNFTVLLALHTPGDVYDLGTWLPFYVTDAPMNVGDLLTKFASGVLTGLSPAGAQELLLETAVLLALAFGVATVPKTAKSWQLVYWAVGLFGVYVATCAVFQSQYRYITTVLPIAIILAIAGGARVLSRGTPTRWLPRGVAVVSCAAVLCLSGVVTRQYSVSAVAARVEVQQWRAVLPADDSAVLMVGGEGGEGLESIVASYAFAPRLMLMTRTTDVDRCISADDLQTWDVGTLVAPAPMPREEVESVFCNTTLAARLKLLNADAKAPPGTVQVYSGNVQIYRIDDSRT